MNGTMQSSGEITVTGRGQTFITLKSHPRHINVRFEKEKEVIPCNPHHHDHLEWHLAYQDEDRRHHHDPVHDHHDRQFLLDIEWQVSGVRTIYWSVLY
jgi:hypothetical protein